MTAPQTSPAHAEARTEPHDLVHGHGAAASDDGVHRVRVLLFSDDRTVRDAVRVGVGRRPARDVEVVAWQEFATAEAAKMAAEEGGYDLLILDGEAPKNGGMGLCRELKNEIFECPPVLVLTGRPQDSWLAAWSLADYAVPHPLDPSQLSGAVARLARGDASTAR